MNMKPRPDHKIMQLKWLKQAEMVEASCYKNYVPIAKLCSFQL